MDRPKSEELTATSWAQVVDALSDLSRENNPGEPGYGLSTRNFDKLVFHETIVIDLQIPVNGVNFIGCVFEGIVKFYNQESCNTNFLFINCFFEREIHFNGIYSKLIEFTSGHIHQVSLNYCKLDRLNINTDCGEIFVGSCEIKSLKIQGQANKKIVIEYLNYEAIDFLGEIFVNDVNIESFLFKHILRKDTIFYCRDIYVQTLSFDTFTNFGNLAFFKLNVPNLITPEDASYLPNLAPDGAEMNIYQSNLGKAEFYSIDFRRFTRVNIVSSLLTSTSFVNVDWPEKFFADSKQELSSTIEERKRDAYRQIKFVLSKQEDYVGETTFHGLEMNSYLHSLKHDPSSATKARAESKSNTHTLTTRFILWASWITSNYGQSFWRPISVMIYINTLLIWLLHFTPESTLTSFNLSWKSVEYTLGEFFRISNPLHKNEPELNGVSLIIDTGIRVVSSYCIYNFVRATRRFVK